MKFTVTPANATVEIKDSQDNVIEAETDGTYKLEVGTYTYTVSAEGYVTQTDTFMVAQGDQTITVNLVLDEKAVALATINSVVAGDNYGQNERQEMRKALEENAETLGLDLTEYNKITVDGRKDAVGWDFLANRPEGGYSVATLQSMLNEIVLTRQTTEVSLNMVNEAESLGDIEFATMLLDRFQASEDNNYKIHSGLLVTEKINTLQDLKNRYDNLASDANRDKVLQKIIEGRPYARSQATTDALNTALTEVEAKIETLLQEVNSADESGMKAIIADSVKAEILGLETGENSRYFELAEGRRPAVATDLYYNRPKEGGYNPATLQKYFNEIVETRHVTQESVNLVNNAKNNVKPLNGLEFVQILKDRFDIVSYEYHSRALITTKVQILQNILEAFKNLESDDARNNILTQFLNKYTASTDTIIKIGELLNVDTTGYKN